MIRLELFRGMRTLGTVSWEPPGWVTLRMHDAQMRRSLLDALGGPMSKTEEEGEVRFRPEELPAAAFERICLDLAREGGLLVAARPEPR